MADINTTIKKLQDKVEEAKKGVRATMTVEELSRGSIRDIFGEVGETNAYLNSVFDKQDTDLGVTTRELRNELNKLVEESTDASRDRLSEIEQRAKDIATVAGEEGTDESELIKQMAQNVRGAARKARSVSATSGSTAVLGESLFTGLFGDKFGRWLLDTPAAGKNQKKRRLAELRLQVAQSRLSEMVGGGVASSTEYAAEEAEEKREAEIRETDVKRKEDEVIGLLHQILLLLGKNGVALDYGGTVPDGAGAAGGDAGSGGIGVGDVVTTIGAAGGAATIANPTSRNFIWRNIRRVLGLGANSTKNMASRTIPRAISTGLFWGSQGWGRTVTAKVTEKSTMAMLSNGMRLVVDKFGKITIRNSAGRMVKNQAMLLEQLGLPSALRAGSTADDALKIAIKSGRMARPGFWRNFLNPRLTARGLGRTARTNALFMLPFATYDVLSGMTESYKTGGHQTLGEMSMDATAAYGGATKMLRGITWLNELLGQDLGTNEEIAQGLEAAFHGVDMSKQWDMMNVILPARRKRQKKLLKMMAGGFDPKSTHGKRIFYSGQLMNLLYDLKQNPNMTEYQMRYVDDPPGYVPKPRSVTSVMDSLIDQLAYAIAEDEAKLDGKPLDQQRVIQIRRMLKEGRFAPLDATNGVSLLPTRIIDKDKRVHFRAEIINNLMESGGFGLHRNYLNKRIFGPSVSRNTVDTINQLNSNASLRLTSSNVSNADRALAMLINQDNRQTNNTTMIADPLLDDAHSTINRERINVNEENFSLS